jgi:hypothetical protein
MIILATLILIVFLLCLYGFLKDNDVWYLKRVKAAYIGVCVMVVITIYKWLEVL